MNKLPPFNSYWVVANQIMAGEYPGADYYEAQTERRLDALLEAGVTAFIDLTETHERVPYALLLQERASYYQVTVKHQRFSIGDFGIPSRALMQQILTAIHETVIHGGIPYIHCWAGLGRTGTVVGTFFVQNGLGSENALEKVQNLCYYGRSPQTESQRNFIRNWH